MFLDAKQCIEKNWLLGNISEESIQPNALDFTIDELFTIHHSKPALLTTDTQEMNADRRLVKNEIVDLRDYFHMYERSVHNIKERRINGWKLEPRTQYIGRSNIKLNLPENVYGIIMPRSSFNRNGVFITAHVHGKKDEYIEFLIVNNGYTCIEVGTRIGQILIAAHDSDTSLVAETTKQQPEVENITENKLDNTEVVTKSSSKKK